MANKQMVKTVVCDGCKSAAVKHKKTEETKPGQFTAYYVCSLCGLSFSKVYRA